MCVCMCARPWSGPFLSPLKLLCMHLLRHIPHFTNKLHALHFVISSLFSFLPYLIWLFNSTLSPTGIPSSLLFAFFILYTPHHSFFFSTPSATFLPFIYPSAHPLLSLSFWIITPLSLQLTPTSLPCPLLSLSLSLSSQYSRGIYICEGIFVPAGGLGRREECAYVCMKTEKRCRSRNAV